MPRDIFYRCGLWMKGMWTQETYTPAPVSLPFSILRGSQVIQSQRVVQNTAHGSACGVFCFHEAGPTCHWAITMLLSGQGYSLSLHNTICHPELILPTKESWKCLGIIEVVTTIRGRGGDQRCTCAPYYIAWPECGCREPKARWADSLEALWYSFAQRTV